MNTIYEVQAWRLFGGWSLLVLTAIILFLLIRRLRCTKRKLWYSAQTLGWLESTIGRAVNGQEPSDLMPEEIRKELNSPIFQIESLVAESRESSAAHQECARKLERARADILILNRNSEELTASRDRLFASLEATHKEIEFLRKSAPKRDKLGKFLPKKRGKR